jgi:ATP-dependent protease ClpP protease subunit
VRERLTRFLSHLTGQPIDKIVKDTDRKFFKSRGGQGVRPDR